MSRVIRLPQGIRINYNELTDEQREKVDQELAEWEQVLRRNPLRGWEPIPAVNGLTGTQVNVVFQANGMNVPAAGTTMPFYWAAIG